MRIEILCRQEKNLIGSIFPNLIDMRRLHVALKVQVVPFVIFLSSEQTNTIWSISYNEKFETTASVFYALVVSPSCNAGAQAVLTPQWCNLLL